jgi:hypothetical protein
MVAGLILCGSDWAIPALPQSRRIFDAIHGHTGGERGPQKDISLCPMCSALRRIISATASGREGRVEFAAPRDRGNGDDVAAPFVVNHQDVCAYTLDHGVSYMVGHCRVLNEMYSAADDSRGEPGGQQDRSRRCVRRSFCRAFSPPDTPGIPDTLATVNVSQFLH